MRRLGRSAHPCLCLLSFFLFPVISLEKRSCYTYNLSQTMTMLNNPKTAATPAPHATDKPKYKGKSGAQILHEMLISTHKVDVMFGYPGGAILPVFDQL